MKSLCCSDVICMSTAGSGLPAGTRICAKCGKEIEMSSFMVIKDAPIPTPSFYEPVVPEPDKQPESPVLDAYEPGLDRELFPELHEVKPNE